ncbi:MAG: glutamate 5-kinase [bacterium]
MNIDLRRKNILDSSRKIVIKIGTRVLTAENGKLDEKRIENLVKGISLLRKNRKETVIVTSGAIGAGMGKLGILKRPKDIPQKQALAAIGQSELMHVYEKYFKEEGVNVGQMLLTQDDLIDRKRFLNASNTLNNLLNFNAVPIINENDTIAIDEIKFGDNDNLSVQVSNLVHADLLLILTSTDGLFSADPRRYERAELIPVVEKIDAVIEKIAGTNIDETSIGGMHTKIQAAKKAVKSGVGVIIANGNKRDIISRIFSYEEEGTFFLPQKNKMTCRKKWIAFSSKSKGIITVDKGAYLALMDKGKSLLPSGITKLSGKFKIGDRVIVASIDNQEFACGLVNYNYEDLEKIKGKNTDDIKNILGYKDYDEVIHRDNLVLLKDF